MRIPLSSIKPIGLSILAASVLAACGGGGSSGNDTSAPGVETQPSSTQMTMSCVDGPNYQCSGGKILKTENGVTLTDSGVEVYGKSTSDLVSATNPDKTTATGLALASGGVAEVRVAKDVNGVISKIALLLSNLGLSWDGKVERPQTIETFDPTQGRTVLTANGAIKSVPLPDSSDLSFYDYATKGVNATQANYANNRYFPRTAPSRCEATQTSCLTIETDGVHYQAGDWRNGGATFDTAHAIRAHEDGDIHAGNATPGPNGEVRWLQGGNGVGVPHPGSKGYRTVDNWSLQYGNLTTWFTQDTVLIAEWGGGDEHNKIRRGAVAFGAVTDPAAVPASGTATYSGIVYGWYARNASEDPAFFRGNALVTVNLATREATIAIQNTVANDSSSTTIPVALSATTKIGASGTMNANYMTGVADNGTLKGGISGRYFGPVVSTGSSGSAPAEIGGAFSLSNASTGATGIGGFLAKKQ